MTTAKEVTNLVIEKGSNFSTEITVVDENGNSLSLVGIGTANSTIRKHSASTISENFTIVVDEPTGKVTLSLTDTQTSNLEVGRNYFDVLIYNSGKRIKYIKGTAIVEDTMTA